MSASTGETATLDDTRSPARRHAEVTDLDKVRAERLAAAQQRRAAARTRDLTALLRERPDLAGVHAPADFAVDALRWCV
jgi:hypothetical protein